MKLFMVVIFVYVNFCYASISLSPEKVDNELELFRLMRFTSVREAPMTMKTVVDHSLVIVRGKIVSITQGREIDYNPGSYTGPLRTSLIKVEVSKVIKGDAGKYVYVEYMSAGIPAEKLNERKYTGETLFFLKDPGWDESVSIVDSPNGLMHEADKLYVLTTHRGLIIQKKTPEGTKIEQPLEDVDPLFQGSSFEDIEQEILDAYDNAESYGFKGLKKPKLKE